MTERHERNLAALLADRSWLERLALRLVKDPAAADDLVQETMVRAWRGGPDDAAAHPIRRRGWLRTVLRRLAIQRHRSEGRRAAREREVAPFEDGDAFALERARMRRDLVDEVLRLPEPERTAVTHRYLEERSYAEIAALHALSEPAARKRVSRGIAQLRQRLNERHGGRGGWALLLVPGAHLGDGPAIAAMATTIGTFASKNTGAWWLTMKTTTKLACIGLFAVGIGALAWISSQQALGIGLDSTRTAKAPGPVRGTQELAQVHSGAVRRSVTAALAKDRAPAAPGSSPAFPERPKDSTGTLDLKVQWQDGAPAWGVAARITPFGDQRGRLRARHYRTDKEGRIVLNGLSAGTVFVSLDRCRGSSYKIEPAAVTEGHLTIPQGFQVEGTVTGPQGAPAAGAEVLMTEYGNAGAVKVVATTDLSGRYAIRDVEAGRDVSARAAGFSPSLTGRLGDHPPGAVHRMDLSLRQGAGGLSGVVLDPMGIPIRDALVQVQPPAITEGYRKHNRHATETWTDEEGRFDFEACGSGDVRLSVRTELHQPYRGSFKVAPGEELDVVIAMEHGALLTGRVTRSDGFPAASGGVSLSQQHDRIPRGLRAQIDSDGTFRLTGLPFGTYDVSANERDQGKVRASITLAARETKHLDLKLELGRIVTGRVLDERGEPLVGWMVGTKMVQGGWDCHTRCRADGSFRLVNVGAYASDLDVTTPGGWQVGTVIRVPITTDAVTVRVPDALRPSASLSLRVLVDGRAPSPPAKVGWSHGSGNGSIDGFTDANGEVTLRGLRPGRGRLWVSAAGFPKTSRTATLEPDKALEVGTIHLGAGGTVRVELSLAPGIRPDEMPGQITLLDDEGQRATFFDLKDGVGESEALGAGRYQISTSWNVTLEGPPWITVKDGKKTVHQATVQPAAPVLLTVESPLPALLPELLWAGFYLEIRRPDGSLVRRERDVLMPGGPENVAIPGLAPGRYTIRIDAERGLSGEVECDVPAADPKTPRQEGTRVQASITLRPAEDRPPSR